MRTSSWVEVACACWALAWLAGAAAAPAAERETGGRRPAAPSDVLVFRGVTDVRVSPAGGQAVLAVEWADPEEDAFTSDLYLVPLEAAGRAGVPGGGTAAEPRPLTRHPAHDGRPRWSPDGRRLAFLSDRAGEDQIHAMDLSGGEPVQVTRAPEGIQEYDWSPDGAWIVYSTLEPKQRAPGGNATERGEPGGVRSSSAGEPIVVTRTQIKRDGEGYLDERRTHLWVVSSRGGEPRRLTGGSPEQARFDDGSPRWSPDGKWIAFVSNRTVDPDANHNTDLWVIPPAGGEIRRVTTNPGSDEAPSWAPDGRRLAWVANLHANNYFTLENLMVGGLEGGEPRNLSGRLDRWVAAESVINGGGRAEPFWSADGRTVHVTTEHEGRHRLTAFPADEGEARDLLQGPFTVDYAGLDTASGRIVFALTGPLHPYDLYSSDGRGGDLRRLTALNDEPLGRIELSVPETFRARNPAGDSVESWIYPPAGMQKGRKYPLILYIHGGPQGFDGDYWDAGLENQIFPGRGWAVLRVNYRGSTSYGEKFSRALQGDWHWREHEDLMAALDEALRRYPWIDRGRLGIGGWSYGGIMTIWAVGHTERFKVGVPERFEVDYPALYGVDQWHIQYETEFGSPFRNRDKYWKHSPLRFIEQIRTPLYLISNALDMNCPLPQAEQFYQGLKYLGRSPELVIYPGEPHSMTHPSHLIDRLERLLVWFGRHLDEVKP